MNVHFESSDYDDIKYIIRRSLEKLQVGIMGKSASLHSLPAVLTTPLLLSRCRGGRRKELCVPQQGQPQQIGAEEVDCLQLSLHGGELDAVLDLHPWGSTSNHPQRYSLS